MCGEVCVMTIGQAMMQEWHADSWATLINVSLKLATITIKCMNK